MSKPKTTIRNLGGGRRQETLQYRDGSGRSTTYKNGTFGRKIEKLSKWRGK